MSTNISPIKLKPIEKVVIIVDLMVGITPDWAESRGDLYKLISGITGMEEDEAKTAIRIAEEQKLIKYFNPFDDAQD